MQSKQIEFSFAMMLSSPTLNMILLTMVFSLFPLYMALTKVFFTLFVIFAVVPFFSHWLAREVKVQGFEALAAKGPTFEFNLTPNPRGGIFLEFWGAVYDFLKAFKFLALRTVPLMFVAGFLGSVVSHLIPFERISGASGAVAVIVTAAVGLFLPVPMAFDAVLTNALFVGGLSPALALTLLCTLGIFSSYSFMVVWNSASKKWAVNLASAIFVLGVGVGLMGNWMDRVFYLEPNIRDYQALKAPPKDQKSAGPVLGASAGSALGPLDLAAAPEPLLSKGFLENEQVKVTAQPFAKAAAPTGRFEKHEGVDLGLERGFVYGIRDYPDPFWFGRGTASGDVNQDGWVDVVFGSDEGPKLYLNQGGRFVEVKGFLADMAQRMVFAVALIDWNNDGLLDLFMTTFNQGNWLALNSASGFGAAQKVPNNQAVMTISPSFADFNGDGWLDVYNGNMSLGIITGFRAYGL
jgi:uncharacterized membrane protein YraQ (UPF0718 family)